MGRSTRDRVTRTSDHADFPGESISLRSPEQTPLRSSLQTLRQGRLLFDGGHSAPWTETDPPTTAFFHHRSFTSARPSPSNTLGNGRSRRRRTGRRTPPLGRTFQDKTRGDPPGPPVILKPFTRYGSLRSPPTRVEGNLHWRCECGTGNRRWGEARPARLTRRPRRPVLDTQSRKRSS